MLECGNIDFHQDVKFILIDCKKIEEYLKVLLKFHRERINLVLLLETEEKSIPLSVSLCIFFLNSRIIQAQR